MTANLDQDAIHACADLVGRTGAEHLRASGFDAFVIVEDEDTPEVTG